VLFVNLLTLNMIDSALSGFSCISQEESISKLNKFTLNTLNIENQDHSNKAWLDACYLMLPNAQWKCQPWSTQCLFQARCGCYRNFSSKGRSWVAWKVKIIVLYVCHVSVLIAALPKENLLKKLRELMTKLQKDIGSLLVEHQGNLPLLKTKIQEIFQEVNKTIETDFPFQKEMNRFVEEQMYNHFWPIASDGLMSNLKVTKFPD